MSVGRIQYSVAQRFARWYWPAVVVIAAAAVILRFWDSERPGYDVDESVYERIAANFARRGVIAEKGEYAGTVDQLYTSHPPFPFMLLGGWFRLIGTPGLVQARWLAAGASVATIVLIAMFLRKPLGNWALLASGLIAVDGWITFTNRVGWLENYQFPLGIAALWYYRHASESRSRKRLFVAGLLLGGVLVFKHVGVYFMVAAIIHRMITTRWQPSTRRPYRAWAWAAARGLVSPLIIGPLVVALAYVAGMIAWAGPEYRAATQNQILRLVGLRKSPGAIKSTSDIIQPLLHQYGIYAATVVMLALTGLLIVGRLVQAARHRSLEPLRRADALLLSWALAGYLVFGLAGLKFPHYLFMIMLPAYCYLIAELWQWVQERGRHGAAPLVRSRLVVTACLCVVLALSGLYATYARVIARNDNAVGQTILWFQRNAAQGDRVIADEFIGQQIPQPYCGIKHVGTCLSKGQPRYVVAYTTTTQKLPDDGKLKSLINRGIVVVRFTGFKERIIVYRIP
jgi:4-amino-4-deoxy-L-arabinose transferase-like glycosyltransferase